MQPKVSMVMPCYNKMDYIAEMLDSIILQKWDNIELIVVNDGSTDGSYEIVLDYVPKIEARGYKCVIIDQKNAGCCAALRNGLAAATGEYICVVDSDDELDSYYVFVMAGFLEENKEFDYTVCDRIEYKCLGNEKAFSDFSPRVINDEGFLMAELYIAGLINPMAWVYMVRAEYFMKCGIVESFVVDTKGSYEPGFNIPLLAHKGRMKYFALPLYHFQVNGEGHSRFKKFAQAKAFQDEYLRLCEKAIESLPTCAADKDRKEHLETLAYFYKLLGLMNYSRIVLDGEEHTKKYLDELFTFASNWLGIPNFYGYSCNSNCGCLTYTYMMIEKMKKMLITKQKPGACGKVIGFAARSRKALEIMPRIKNTSLEPVELWDINADCGELYGISIKKPDFDSLCGDETALLLTVNRVAVKEITENLVSRGVRNIVYADALLSLK